jgi:hypothetical protein
MGLESPQPALESPPATADRKAPPAASRVLAPLLTFNPPIDEPVPDASLVPLPAGSTAGLSTLALALTATGIRRHLRGRG